MSEYQRRASWLRTSPSPTREREASGREDRTGKWQSLPQRGILYQTTSRLPVANQDFFEFWMVDICQECRSQRSAPQKRHTAHLRWALWLQPRKPSGWDPGGDQMHSPGLSHSGSGSGLLHKGADSVGPRFVPFPGPSSSGDQVLGASYRLPHPSHSVSWVCIGSTISGVPCISSGELISGCDPPSGCQPSRIPGRLG